MDKPNIVLFRKSIAAIEVNINKERKKWITLNLTNKLTADENVLNDLKCVANNSVTTYFTAFGSEAGKKTNEESTEYTVRHKYRYQIQP